MQPGLSLDDIIARKRAQVKAKKNGKVVAPIEEEKEVNEDDESGAYTVRCFLRVVTICGSVILTIKCILSLWQQSSKRL